MTVHSIGTNQPGVESPIADGVWWYGGGAVPAMARHAPIEEALLFSVTNVFVVWGIALCLWIRDRLDREDRDDRLDDRPIRQRVRSQFTE